MADAVSSQVSASCQVPAGQSDSTYQVYLWTTDLPTEVGAFTVVGGSDVTVPPTITDLTTTPTVAPGGQVTLSWRASDASGVTDSRAYVLAPSPPCCTERVFGFLAADYSAAVTRQSGTAADGVYSQTITLAPDAPEGTYTAWIAASDGAGLHGFDEIGGGADGSEPVTFTVAAPSANS